MTDNIPVRRRLTELMREYQDAIDVLKGSIQYWYGEIDSAEREIDSLQQKIGDVEMAIEALEVEKINERF